MAQRVTILSFLFFLGCIVNIIVAQNETKTDNILEYSGSVSGQTIVYQAIPQKIGNILNPVTVSIMYDQPADNVEICLNSYQLSFPVSGVNMQYSCPNGGYGVVSNSTSDATTPPPAQFYKRVSKENGKFVKMVQEIQSSTPPPTNLLFLKPSNEAGFVVAVPGLSDDTTMNFNIVVTATYCEDPDLYPIGDGSCLEIANLTTAGVAGIPVPANQWVYYRFSVGEFDSTSLNSFSFVQNNSKKVDMFVQSGYFPTSTWFLVANVTEDDDDNLYQTIDTPSRYTVDSESIYYVGLYNTDSSNVQYVSLNVSINTCNDTNYVGPNCGIAANNTANPLSGIYPVSANISSSASSVSFDYSDSDAYADTMAYFYITDLPEDIGDDYFVRVSAGNNFLGKYDFPPALYAKLNGYPSLESHDYNISNNADAVANQLSLPVSDPDVDQWYIAVQLPASFTLWVGYNCHDNCADATDGGSCTCSINGTSTPCNFTSADNITIADYYTIPTNLADSSGICACTSSSYSKSFDCSEKPDYHIPYLIILLLIGIGIIAVAIAIPVYRYIKRQKNNSYDPL